MSYAFVQATSSFHDTPQTITSQATAFGSNVTSGNLLIAGISWDSSTGAALSATPVSDTRGSTWHQVGTTLADTTNGQSLALFYAIAAGSGANTVTFSFTTGTGFTRMPIAEYSGIAATSTLVTSAQAKNASATTASNNAKTSTATAGASGQLVVGFVGVNDQAETYTAGSSPNAFSSRVQDSSTSGGRVDLEDCAAPSTSALSATWTLSVASSSGMSSYIAIFALSSSAVPGTGSGSFGITGSASGSAFLPASGAGSFGLTGAGAGSVFLPASGSDSFALSGSATGSAFVPATAAGTFGLSGAAAGATFLSGAGTGSFGVSGAATGTTFLPATGSGSFSLAGSATASGAYSGAGTGSFSISGTAAGSAHLPATGTGSFATSGSASGSTDLPASGSSGFSLTGSATGSAHIPATGTGSFSFTGTAAGSTGQRPPLITLPTDLFIYSLNTALQGAGASSTSQVAAGTTSGATLEGATTDLDGGNVETNAIASGVESGAEIPGVPTGLDADSGSSTLTFETTDLGG